MRFCSGSCQVNIGMRIASTVDKWLQCASIRSFRCIREPEQILILISPESVCGEPGAAAVDPPVMMAEGAAIAGFVVRRWG